MEEKTAHYTSASMVTDADLKKKVSNYKNLFFWLMATGLAMLVCAIVYIILLFASNKNIYQPFDSKLIMGDKIAADSSGRLIAFPVYDNKDSTMSILVSSDSGRHFEQEGGPWENKDEFADLDLIQSIGIAPDNKSIVALSREYLYIKTAGKNDFDCIKTSTLPNSSIYAMGFCFVPGTDSIYVYDYYGTVACLSYKSPDSVVTGHLGGIQVMQSMTIGPDKRIYVIKNSGQKNSGVYINCRIDNIKTYAITAYNGKEDAAKTIMADSSKKFMDTSKMIQPIDTASAAMDSTKKS